MRDATNNSEILECDVSAAGAKAANEYARWNSVEKRLRELQREYLLVTAAISWNRRLLAFRNIGEEYQYWPIGLITVGPTIGFGLGFIVGHATTQSFAVAGLSGLLVASLVLFVLAFFHYWKSDSEIADELSRGLARLQSIELELHDCKLRRPSLTDRKDRSEALYVSLRDRFAEQERARSIQYRCEQLYNTNWRDLRGIPFEQFLEQVFRLHSATVHTTKTSGDQGVDLLVIRNGHKIAVQAKGYTDKVGNSAVQEAHAGKTFYGCDHCVVITNSRFTKSARELASRLQCSLIDMDSMRAFVVNRQL